ncbi:MAG: hypothetical protein KAV42_11060 [Candidatus Krumholzibacteria bacterium]|nr:hypothetical protein [Candidatus Krumholzibacteria bacterium]
MIRKGVLLTVLTVLAVSMLHSPLSARNDTAEWAEKLKKMEQIWVFDGSGIHNVGNLQMHVTNWGCFGSYPSSNWPTAEFPSAQWPANSGTEYLYIAGLWIGAKKGGIPVVSTSAYEIEFRPPGIENPEAKIYRAFEGIQSGARLPSPDDDDKDGVSDEDWQNGIDDDGDGLIDEDFGAIGKQMFTCWTTDDDPTSVQVNPEHTPLHLFIRQESYQWEEEQFYDFVGIEYKIKNYGSDIIEDLYIGFFADGDAGKRDREQYWTDDCTGLFEGIRCAQKGENEIPVRLSVAYFYDKDGDDGACTGYFGIIFLGHDIDPLGENAPKTVGLTSYQNFSGDQPYENGGDPTNDFQRYELMSKTQKDRNAEVPRDYRMMMATGPFRELLPDSSMILQVAFVCGEGLDGMLDAAASATMAFQGNWFDIDGNPQTGIDGRETPVPGPVSGIVADSCAAGGDLELLSAARGEIIWINNDCRNEIELWENTECAKGDATFSDFQTGVDGKETQVNWLVGSAPPPPNMRLLPGDNKVVVMWDNFSEVTPDVSTLELDFEGYRIWRADGWTRPMGTSVLSGPPRNLWQLIEERDIMNGVRPDIDFRYPISEIRDNRRGWQYVPLEGLDGKDAIIRLFEESVWYSPLDTVPCPPGLSNDECDTLEAMARYNLGFEGGLQYYKFIDESVHNGMHYFYSVTAYDHMLSGGVPIRVGKFGDSSSNFMYISPLSDPQDAEEYDDDEVYVVPNPATAATMSPWQLDPNMDDPTGIKVEFRNLPLCRNTVRIFTMAGDLVEILYHDGASAGQRGTLVWDLVSRNGQNVTSGVYLFAVEPEDDRFEKVIGKFVIIR